MNFHWPSLTEQRQYIDEDIQALQSAAAPIDGVVLRGPWEIAGLGALVRHNGKSCKLAIEILLSEWRAVKVKGQSFTQLQPPIEGARKVTALLPLMQIRDIYPGFVFGYSVFPSWARVHCTPAKTTGITLSLESANFKLTNIEGLPHDAQTVLREQQTPSFVKNQQYLAVRREPSDAFVIFPCTEIYRHFFARSYFLNQCIFDGTIFNADGGIWSTQFEEVDNEEHYIINWYIRRPPKAEISFVAKFAISPWAMNQAENIIRYLATSAGSHHFFPLRAIPSIRGRAHFFVTTFPNDIETDTLVVRSIIHAREVGGEGKEKVYPFRKLTSKYMGNVESIPLSPYGIDFAARGLEGQIRWPWPLKFFPSLRQA